MHKLEELREMLCEELDKIAKKGELSAGSLEVVDKLTHSIKSIDTIMAMEESGYSGEGGYSYAGGGGGRGGNSGARGQRRNSRGQYSREGGNSYARGGGNRGGGRSRGGNSSGYSYDDSMEELREQLQEMEGMAKDERTRRMVREWMEQIEE